MAGLSYIVEIDNRSMREELKRKLRRMENLEPFHRNVGEQLLNSVDDRFQTETAPDGSPWQRHAPATVKSRLRRNGNAPLIILRESGRLAGSFNYDATREHTKIGTSLVYAAIHHFGGETGRNHSVEMPARPVLGLSPADEAEIEAIAEEFLSD